MPGDLNPPSSLTTLQQLTPHLFPLFKNYAPFLRGAKVINLFFLTKFILRNFLAKPASRFTFRPAIPLRTSLLFRYL